MKILLVEDDDLKARLLQRVCRVHGIETEKVEYMIAAVRTIQERGNEFAGVLTDWQFPFREDDGRGPRDGAGRYVYDEARRAGLPVAVISGRELPVDGVEPWITTSNFHALNIWLKQLEER